MDGERELEGIVRAVRAHASTQRQQKEQQQEQQQPAQPPQDKRAAFRSQTSKSSLRWKSASNVFLQETHRHELLAGFSHAHAHVVGLAASLGLSPQIVADALYAAGDEI
jgi:hypothetical protein